MMNEIKPYPYVIAEVGASHDGNRDTAVYLIHEAKAAGCHAVKFQAYDAERLAGRRHAPGSLQGYRTYEIPFDWYPDLVQCAHALELDFILSVYDEQDLCMVHQYADLLKISSFECRDTRLLRAATKYQKPVIISTGMCVANELSALRCFRFTAKVPVYLLHCISAYPAPAAQLGLSAIGKYSLDGFSDHSANVFSGAVAVACGAKILEAHLRGYATGRENPDYAHSLAPDQLVEYVRGAVHAAHAIGSGHRKLAKCEEPNTAYRVRA